MSAARWSRRRFLGVLGGTAVLAGAAGCGAVGLDTPPGQTGELLTTRLRLPVPFQVPLPVPPVIRPVGRLDDADLYVITQRVARPEILPGVPTTVWGYDGIFPDPRSRPGGDARSWSGTATSCRCRRSSTCTAGTPRPSTTDGPST